MSSPRSSSSGASSRGSRSPTRPLDPISRTALRYTLSPREYELLHQYLISRAPSRVQQSTPTPKRFAKLTRQRRSSADTKDDGVRREMDDNTHALRTALRVFVLVYSGAKGYDSLMQKLAERRGHAKATTLSSARYGNARLALSFSGILFVHKLLYRFFHRVRGSLLQDGATSFRRRNPRVAKLLTSPYTPALGAAFSGAFLAVSPADQLRITLAIYVFSRTLEFGFNALAEGGYLWKSEEDGGAGRPWWFGSWLIMPFACGQLLHAFVFDRDCFPADYGKFIVQRSPEYIQLRPADYPRDRPWPGTFDIVDALAEISKVGWPPFQSPILFPGSTGTLSPALEKVSPVTSAANPSILYTSCAVLHPNDPSCLRTFIKYFARAFPGAVRFFTMIYGAFGLLAYKSLLKSPLAFLNRLSARILRMALFVTGAIGTSWASICFFNIYLPRAFLPTQRWFVGGFAGGMWAFIARFRERGNFLYSARLSIDSLYKVGRKRGWWRGVQNGDVLLFIASLALLNYTYEARPSAVQGAMIRKTMGFLRCEGFTDRVEPTSDDGKERLKREEEQEIAIGERMKEE